MVYVVYDHLRMAVRRSAVTRLLALDLDPRGLRAIVDERLSEPRVLERLLGRYPLLRVVDEDLLQEIEELLVEFGVWWDRVLCYVSVWYV